MVPVPIAAARKSPFEAAKNNEPAATTSVLDDDQAT